MSLSLFFVLFEHCLLIFFIFFISFLLENIFQFSDYLLCWFVQVFCLFGVKEVGADKKLKHLAVIALDFFNFPVRLSVLGQGPSRLLLFPVFTYFSTEKEEIEHFGQTLPVICNRQHFDQIPLGVFFSEFSYFLQDIGPAMVELNIQSTFFIRPALLNHNYDV